MTQKRPISPFSSLDDMPKELQQMQKMLKIINQTQKNQSSKIQANNEAMVLINQQLNYMSNQLEKTNYYLALLVTMQQYIVDNTTLLNDVEQIRNVVDQTIAERFEQNDV